MQNKKAIVWVLGALLVGMGSQGVARETQEERNGLAPVAMPRLSLQKSSQVSDMKSLWEQKASGPVQTVSWEEVQKAFAQQKKSFDEQPLYRAKIYGLGKAVSSNQKGWKLVDGRWQQVGGGQVRHPLHMNIEHEIKRYDDFVKTLPSRAELPDYKLRGNQVALKVVRDHWDAYQIYQQKTKNPVSWAHYCLHGENQEKYLEGENESGIPYRHYKSVAQGGPGQAFKGYAFNLANYKSHRVVPPYVFQMAKQFLEGQKKS